MKFVVGLTGGIGSGKTAVAEEFERLGATIVDADAIAHQLTAAGGAAMPRIVSAFGAQFATREGALDRRKMRERVFSDVDARTKLEHLLHPMIREEAERRTVAAEGKYVVLVVPLLVESHDYRSRVNRLLVVDCPEEMQVQRVRTRSGLPEEQVRAIMASQAKRAERLAAADDVIDNSGTLDALRKQVVAMHRRYLEMAEAASS